MEIIRDYINREELKSKHRKREKSYIRFYIYAYLKHTYKLTLMQIGKEFNRDHASILYGIKQYNFFKNDKLFNSITRDVQREFEMGVIPTSSNSSCIMFEILREQDLKFVKQ